MLPPRRNTELGLIVLVALVVSGAYTLASLGKDARIPVNILPFLLFVLGLLLAAHVVLRRLAPNADGTLLPLVGLLNGLGFVLIARVNERLAWQQAAWTAFGVALFCLTLLVVRRARDLANYRWTFALGGIVLLMAPLVPRVGQEINDSRIWIGLGGFTFQPGELAKIALAIFFAGYLVDKREILAMRTWGIGRLRLPDPKHLGPVMLAWGASLIVMFYQKDLGSSLLFFTLFVVMLWVATERASYLVVGAGLFSVGAWFAYQAFGHVRTRVSTWLDPWADAKGKGFQLTESAFAMASGGIGGTGLSRGGPIGIPVAESDFIFVVLAQELGLLGGTVVLMAYLLIVGSGYRIAVRADNVFDKLLAVGLTTLVGFQAFLIIGGVTRVLPLTGVTLPWVSAGGSSLVANYILLALLLRVSDETAEVAR